MEKIKYSVDEILESMDSLTGDEKDKMRIPRQIFVPVIRCTDGFIFPSKDITALSTGTFACEMADGSRFIIKPEERKK